jgi:uncharacterized protein
MIAKKIADELGVKLPQIDAAIKLLDGGDTVPFIARYRKELTGALDDQQLRILSQRLIYLRELDARRNVILKNIEEQSSLTPQLRQAILSTDNKTQLEDLYLPYKSKRRTKAQIAREALLDQLLDKIIAKPHTAPSQLSSGFVNPAKGFVDIDGVLEGASAILSDRICEHAELLNRLRSTLTEQAQLHASVVKGQEDAGAKFRDYFDYTEKLKIIPSHRMLAQLRGTNEGILKLKLIIPDEEHCQQLITRYLQLPRHGEGAEWLQDQLKSCWKTRLRTKLQKELIQHYKEQAENEAILVFSRNLRDLLLSAPAGPKVTLGLDPGLRTGVKAVVVDETGKLINYTTIYPHPPKNDWQPSKDKLYELCHRYQVELISIGNGTGSRETEKLVSELLQEHTDIHAQKLITSEAGASVYSASELAAKEFPDLDVTIRGAVSIARRLQDPLAELVKIEPKAIGVGQYQHDVNQNHLSEQLETVIEDCVNAVGVDINSASEALLTRVSGLNQTLANNIVQYRNEIGRFKSRQQLLKVPRLGPKAYEQSAAFLRIRNGTQPLDNSAVHPESYDLVTQIAKRSNCPIAQLIGDRHLLGKLSPSDFISDKYGQYTITDVMAELEKPGRDPRPEFKTARLLEGVESIADLHEGMKLEGTVTNVTNFGAFVDIGVHQDGLVHISQLANKFVKDPHTVVKPGQIVSVRVTEVDIKRKRIALSMKADQ